MYVWYQSFGHFSKKWVSSQNQHFMLWMLNRLHETLLPALFLYDTKKALPYKGLLAILLSALIKLTKWVKVIFSFRFSNISSANHRYFSCMENGNFLRISSLYSGVVLLRLKKSCLLRFCSWSKIRKIRLVFLSCRS